MENQTSAQKDKIIFALDSNYHIIGIRDAIDRISRIPRSLAHTLKDKESLEAVFERDHPHKLVATKIHSPQTRALRALSPFSRIPTAQVVGFGRESANSPEMTVPRLSGFSDALQFLVGSRSSPTLFGISTYNPDERGQNCVSVTISMLLGYENVNEFWTACGVEPNGDEPLEFYDIYDLLIRSSNSLIYQYMPDKDKLNTLFTNIDGEFNVPFLGVCYRRRDGTGHCVIYYRETGQFIDYQRETRGEDVTDDVLDSFGVIFAFAIVGKTTFPIFDEGWNQKVKEVEEARKVLEIQEFAQYDLEVETRQPYQTTNSSSGAVQPPNLPNQNVLQTSGNRTVIAAWRQGEVDTSVTYHQRTRIGSSFGQSYGQGYVQGYAPGPTSTYSPGYGQGYPPGYGQGYPPGYGQGYAPGYRQG